MTTANLAEALPRFRKLQEATKRGVCVSLEVWVQVDGRVETEWAVYVAGNGKTCVGATLEDALRGAEHAVFPTSGVPEVVLP